jgi:hypothetical protein
MNGTISIVPFFLVSVRRMLSHGMLYYRMLSHGMGLLFLACLGDNVRCLHPCGRLSSRSIAIKSLGLPHVRIDLIEASLQARIVMQDRFYLGEHACR